MYFQSNDQAASVISEMMEDIWNAKDKLVSKDKNILLSYRISMDNMTDMDVNVYFHLVVTPDRWYYSTNPNSMFTCDELKELIFDDEECHNRVTSWCRYAFSYVVRLNIEDRLNEVSESLGGTTGRSYLWNTFPLCEYNV